MAGPVEQVVDLLQGRRFVALTGAGVSTDSGIPDYRGPLAPARTPMTFQEFSSGSAARQRYWARSHIGWSRMHAAMPNAAHAALVQLERQAALSFLITQNVDGLHETAGSERMVALHGRIADVRCLSCERRTSRRALTDRMRELNPGFEERHAEAATRPDGDVELDDTHDFVVPDCDTCGGILKPDVVFFGESVPQRRVQLCYDVLAAAEALLVVGSSLTVMSGFRFVRRAHQDRRPVVIVNRGGTRGDPLATLKVDAGAGPFLGELLTALQ